MRIKGIILLQICLLFSVLTTLLVIEDGCVLSETTASYSTSKIIILDAGHGGFDGGAVADDGTIEKDINLSVTKRLKELFLLGGFEVVMIREDDVGLDSNSDESIGKRKVSDMKKRLELVNANEEAVFISIHQNNFSSGSARGAQVFYSSNSSESEALAYNIQRSFEQRLQKENKRNIKKADKNIYLLYNAKIPALIVECGFLSNSQELALLKSEEYQKKLAFTIYCGYLDYLSEDAVLK